LQIVKSVKLHRVQAWWSIGNAAPGLIGNTCQLSFSDSTGANLKVDTKDDVQLGASDIGYASIQPAPNTTQSFWQSEGNATPMFEIQTGANISTVMDIDVSLCLSDIFNPTTTGVITGTSGVNNSLGTFTSGNLTPHGYQHL
jgi:hypothetical protein